MKREFSFRRILVPWIVEKAISQFGWANPGSLEQIIQAVMDVTGHLSPEMARKYAKCNIARHQIAVAFWNTVESRRPVMDLSSPYFKASPRHQIEGRILLDTADAPIPKELPPVKTPLPDKSKKKSTKAKITKALKKRWKKSDFNTIPEKKPTKKEGKKKTPPKKTPKKAPAKKAGKKKVEKKVPMKKKPKKK